MIDCSRPFELIRRIGKLGVCLEQDDCLDELNVIIEQLVKKRDAAIADLHESDNCDYCKYRELPDLEEPCFCCGVDEGENKWEWRGVDG